MKAVVKTEYGPDKVNLLEVPEPEPGAGQIKVEVKAAGVCTTDLHISHDRFVNHPPVVLGHEFAGQVVGIGEGVSGVRIGNRVTINPGVGKTCGACRHCRMGYYLLCSQRRGIGSGLNGGFAKFCVVPQQSVCLLPTDVDYDSGALCEPLACVVQAVLEFARVQAGDLVLVSGPGFIGLLTMQLVRAQGGLVVVCGLEGDEQRLAMARQLGAEHTVLVGGEDPRQVVMDLTDGYGADLAFECAGTQSSLKQSLALLSKKGTHIQVGIMKGPVEIDFNDIFFRQLEVRGSFGHNWSSWPRALTLLAEGKIDVRTLISHRRPITEWRLAFKDLEDRTAVKTILYPVD